MGWLRLISMLVELTLNLMKTVESRDLVRRSEISGAIRSQEMTRERLRAALDARNAAPSVRDDDPHLRD